VRFPAAPGADRQHAVRRELLGLVLAVVLVHALFIAGYFLFDFERASDPSRVVYTAAWTAVTLAVVLRALTRIRKLRRRPR
jgi:Kef-type K+ transport system membrane component KefB